MKNEIVMSIIYAYFLIKFIEYCLKTISLYIKGIAIKKTINKTYKNFNLNKFSTTLEDKALDDFLNDSKETSIDELLKEDKKDKGTWEW